MFASMFECVASCLLEFSCLRNTDSGHHSPCTWQTRVVLDLRISLAFLLSPPKSHQGTEDITQSRIETNFGAIVDPTQNLKAWTQCGTDSWSVKVNAQDQAPFVCICLSQNMDNTLQCFLMRNCVFNSQNFLLICWEPTGPSSLTFGFVCLNETNDSWQWWKDWRWWVFLPHCAHHSKGWCEWTQHVSCLFAWSGKAFEQTGVAGRYLIIRSFRCNTWGPLFQRPVWNDVGFQIYVAFHMGHCSVYCHFWMNEAEFQCHFCCENKQCVRLPNYQKTALNPSFKKARKYYGNCSVASCFPT